MRANTLHIINPSSPTLFRMTAIIAHTAVGAERDFDQTSVFDFMDKLQRMIKSLEEAKSIPYIIDFPISSSLLSPEMLTAVYGDAPPVDVRISDLDTVLAGKKQRGRAEIAANKTPVPDWLAKVPAEYHATILASIACSHPDTHSQTSSQPSSQTTPQHSSQSPASSHHGSGDVMSLSSSLRALRASMAPKPIKTEAINTEARTHRCYTM